MRWDARMVSRTHRAHRARFVILVAVCLAAGCGPRVRGPASDVGPSGGDSSVPVDTGAASTVPTTARDVQRYLVTTLMEAGYRCNEDSPTQCMTADDPWQVTVSTRVDPDATWVGFDSYSTRAAGRTCGELRQMIDGLASKTEWFTVSCSDSQPVIRMSTWVTYGVELDVPAWMQQHRTSRFLAYQRLEATGAVTR